MKMVGFLGWATGWVVDAVPEERKHGVGAKSRMERGGDDGFIWGVLGSQNLAMLLFPKVAVFGSRPPGQARVLRPLC